MELKDMPIDNTLQLIAEGMKAKLAQNLEEQVMSLLRPHVKALVAAAVTEVLDGSTLSFHEDVMYHRVNLIVNLTEKT